MRRLPAPPTALARAERAISSYPRPIGFPVWITDEIYTRAVRFALRGHKAPLIAEMLGVSERAAREFMDSSEWRRTAHTQVDEHRHHEAVAATALSSLAMQKTLERLERGDEHLTRRGDIVHLEVSATDAASIALRYAERADTLRRQIDGVPEPNDQSSLENLLRVADVLMRAGAAQALKDDAANSAKDVTPGKPIDAEALGIEIEDIEDAA